MKILQFRRYMYFLGTIPHVPDVLHDNNKVWLYPWIVYVKVIKQNLKTRKCLHCNTFLHNYVSIDIFILETKVLGEQFGQNDAQV